MTKVIKRIKLILNSILKWNSKSINRKIFTSTLILGLIRMFGKIIGMVKQATIANYFGTGNVLDVFLIAFLIPSFLVNVISGSFTAAFMPTLIKVRKNNSNEYVNKFIGNILFISFLLLIFISIILLLINAQIFSIVAPGFDSQKLNLVYKLFKALIPFFVFRGITIIYQTILESEKKFILGNITDAIIPFTIILILVFKADKLGIKALIIGTLIGALMQLIILALYLYKYNVRIFPTWFKKNGETLQVVKQYIPMVAGAFAMSSSGIIDKSMASMLASGSVSTLDYGNRLVATILGISSIALGKVVLPFFSNMVENNDWENIKNTLGRYIPLIFLVSVPVIIITIIFSEPIVETIFERSAFTSHDTKVVSQVLSFYILQLPFYITSIIFVRLISAMKKNKYLFYGALINVTVNLAGNYFFMSYLGVKGIALSTVCVYAASTIYLHIVVKKLMNVRGNK